MRIPQAIYRLLINYPVWKYASAGYCYSCDSNNIFVFSKDIDDFLKNITRNWSQSQQFLQTLLERENYICAYCLANYRMRVLANTILKLIGVSYTRELLQILKKHKNFSIYETANHSIFRAHEFRTLSNYVVSEYYDDSPLGSNINGIRNENLEQLSFQDNFFDVIITSDVLEHVSDLDKALSEIKRVLKPGGYHIFTIPADYKMNRTTERATIKNGLIINLSEPVMHGDTVRNNGILAFRDFGKDTLQYLSRDSLECKEVKYIKNNMHITSVYYSQKKNNRQQH